MFIKAHSFELKKQTEKAVLKFEKLLSIFSKVFCFGGGRGRGDEGDGEGAEGYSLYMLAEALVFAWKLV